MSRRVRHVDRVSVEDLTKLYDAFLEREARKYRRLWELKQSVRRHRNGKQVVQSDVRLDRLKSRASGMRFALTHEDLSYRQKKELEQMLKNIELAIKGIEGDLKTTGE